METGGIFMAWSDRPWILDGAAVRVSMVGFDNDAQTEKTLDGKAATVIHADLTADANLTSALALPENEDLCFLGVMKSGPFDLDRATGKGHAYRSTNPNGRPNSDVVKRRLIGRDVVQRNQHGWLVDFGEMTEEEAALYELPFEYVRTRCEADSRQVNRKRT